MGSQAGAWEPAIRNGIALLDRPAVRFRSVRTLGNCYLPMGISTGKKSDPPTEPSQDNHRQEAHVHLFDRDISLTEQAPLRFEVHVSEHWSINGVPNGGYLMALLANAMLRHSEKQSTPIVTANFVARCTPGAATIAVEKISQSNQFDRLQARLIQDGNERVRAIGTFAKEADENQETRYEGEPPDITPRNECLAVPEMPAYTLYSHMDVRLDPECARWLSGHLSDTSQMKGWIKFKEERSPDILSLLLMSDSFPPAVLTTYGMVAWLPTLEFSLSIRNLPATKWLKSVFRTRFVTNGILEEDGEIWDENGELVAIARQIALYRTRT